MFHRASFSVLQGQRLCTPDTRHCTASPTDNTRLNSHGSVVTEHNPFWRNFAFFSLILIAVHLCAKCEVSSFNSFRDIRGSQNSKNGLRARLKLGTSNLAQRWTTVSINETIAKLGNQGHVGARDTVRLF